MGTSRRGRDGSPARWPPTAEAQTIELSTGAVLGIFLVMEGVAYAAWTVAVGRPFTVVGWAWDPNLGAVARQGIAEPALELLFWALILSALGWVKASGLVVGRASAWGIVPLALFWGVTLMAAALTDVVEKGGWLIAAAVVGVFLSALTEEIAFRGFLYHGLTMTLGGRAAVLVGSALFALVHLPVEIWGYRDEAGVVAGALLIHFCFGVVMCRIRAATGSVWFPAGVHALSNVTIIGIGWWAFPEPSGLHAVFALLRLALVGTGLFLAYGLVMRNRWRAIWANAAIMMQLRAAERASVTFGPGAPSDGLRTIPDAEPPVSTSVFQRFTGAARLAVVLAQEEARTQRDPAIGTEHVLLALVSDPSWIPARALERLGVDLHASGGRQERLMDQQDAPAAPTIPFTPRAKLAIAVAITEADRRGDRDIGPEHLLLGVIADRRGEAVRVLRRLDLSPERVRRAVLDLIGRAATTRGADPEGAVAAPSE